MKEHNWEIWSTWKPPKENEPIDHDHTKVNLNLKKKVIDDITVPHGDYHGCRMGWQADLLAGFSHHYQHGAKISLQVRKYNK